MSRATDYQEVHFCDHCQADTLHRCHDEGHERDMSGDYRICLVCGWRWLGFTGRYAPPIYVQ